ncbi:MAG: glycerate kinase [Solibacillus sp.]
MQIVIAPDSFKGSLSAVEICRVVKAAIGEVAPHAHVTELPLADGGEGTLDCLVKATAGEKRAAVVEDPLGRQLTAYYGILGDGQTAVIELAQASGLSLLSPTERNPLMTSTYGTGQLIKQAVEGGYRKFIIGLGGSATNDAGAGLLKALGVKFYNAEGAELANGGAALRDLHRIDNSMLHPQLKNCAFMIASDVKNTLCGAQGASAIFGPQKGATTEMVDELDAALVHFAAIIQKQYGLELRQLVGGGAAGGVGATLQAFLQADYRSGIDVVMQATGARDMIREATIVFTGEGKLDVQTLSGKVIAGVAHCAKTYQVPVLAVAGAVELNSQQLQQLGITAAFSIVQGPCTTEQALEQTPKWLHERVKQIMQLYLLLRKL